MIEDAWGDFPQADRKEATPENHEAPEHWKPIVPRKQDDKLIGEHPGDWDIDTAK